MEATVLKGMIFVIREERARKLSALNEAEDDDADAAYDQWQFRDEPLVNELCLSVLVTLRHEVERDLVRLAARVSRSPQIGAEWYRRRVAEERRRLRRGGGWADLTAKLRLAAFPEWNSSMETLRVLANCYKHDPHGGPDKPLLRHLKKHLKYQRRSKYASLPESDCFREGLALSLGLGRTTHYCDIAAKLLNEAESFLGRVKQQPVFATVKWGHVSLKPSSFVC